MLIFLSNNGTQAREILFLRYNPVSDLSIVTRSISKIGPASILGKTFIKVTPVNLSPIAMAVSIGEAPR